MVVAAGLQAEILGQSSFIRLQVPSGIRVVVFLLILVIPAWLVTTTRIVKHSTNAQRKVRRPHWALPILDDTLEMMARFNDFHSWLSSYCQQVNGDLRARPSKDARRVLTKRWIDPNTGGLIQVSPFKFPIFHGGPRLCLGINLAMLEMKIVAASLLSKFHIGVLPNQTVTYDIAPTISVKGVVLVNVTSAEGIADEAKPKVVLGLAH